MPFSFLSISALGLSSLILQAMSPEYASFIDQLFAGDKRRRGVWSRELAGKIGAVEIVSPF